jgi:hypothetical protein
MFYQIRNSIYTGCFILFISCSTNHPEAYILTSKHFTNISSASGIALNEHQLFLIGDDSPSLYIVDSAWNTIETKMIFTPDTLLNGRIPKSVKPDFEALALVQRLEQHPHLLVFGSGSLSPTRDVLLRISLKDSSDPVQSSLTTTYKSLYESAEIAPEQLNIEGAEVIENHLFLVNRGDNSLYRFNLDEFLRYLVDSTGLPPVPVRYSFTLPEINGIQARFSGLSSSMKRRILLFTASVENTTNWIDDGEVLGSFIGEIPLNELETGKLRVARLLDADHQPYPVKLESVVFLEEESEDQYIVLAVTDNDDGTSELLKIRVNFQG